MIAQNMAAMTSKTLRMLIANVAVSCVIPGTELIGFGVGCGVGAARVGAIVGCNVGGTIVGAGGATVRAGDGTLPDNGGIIKTAPTRSRVVLVRLFALMISGYLVPSPYTFCAMVQGLSPDWIVYVCALGCPGTRVAPGVDRAAGVSSG